MTVEVDELQSLDGHTHALASSRESAPKRIPLDATSTADASGNALLVFDRVPQGESWDLYRLVVGGVQWSTAAAGTAVVYRTSSQASTTPSLTQVFDEATSLPNVSFYLAKQVSLIAGESLVVYVSGGTTGQQYVASAQFAPAS